MDVEAIGFASSPPASPCGMQNPTSNSHFKTPAVCFSERGELNSAPFPPLQRSSVRFPRRSRRIFPHWSEEIVRLVLMGHRPSCVP
eukprot:1238221-Prymnesium_polylepis.1